MRTGKSNADDLESFCKETDPKRKQEFNRKELRGKKAVLNWYLTIRILSGAALQ